MNSHRAVVVLGNKLSTSKIHPELQGRLDIALSVFQETESQYLILSGGRSNPEVRSSEAELMLSYVVSKGISQSQVILDEKSLDTIGNGYFSCLIVERNPEIKEIWIVSSCYHMPRVAFIFQHCFGENYLLHFNRCFECSLGADNEGGSLEMAYSFFEDVMSGDIVSIGRKLFLNHALYNRTQDHKISK